MTLIAYPQPRHVRPAHYDAAPGSLWSITGTWPDGGRFVDHLAIVAARIPGEPLAVFTFLTDDDLNTASAHHGGARGATAEHGLSAEHITHATELLLVHAAHPHRTWNPREQTRLDTHRALAPTEPKRALQQTIPIPVPRHR